ncbi:dicarboxylate transporter/tellurite-resistance protein TehA [Rhizobium sp. RAF56]|jgi:tellurite resistance protein|uniref:SLAC1 family transporter n=1 Tax=Rhizobium sp. RAF56 TaxID=3233062 RepID=UPI003F9DD0EA
MSSIRLPLVPASFFGMVLGLSGLGTCWRLAAGVWHVPGAVGEVIIVVAAIVWALLVVLYAMKWLLVREEVLKEAAHPVQCCFIGLVGVATMLVSIGLLPYVHLPAEILFAAGSLYTLIFAVWRMGGLWQGGRQDTTNTPVLYLPAVAGTFVTAAGLGALNYADWGQYFFGAGLFTWLAIESVLLHRFFNAAPMAPAMRPTLGVQLAPPAVGAVAYLGVTQGPPDIFAHALIGYGCCRR